MARCREYITCGGQKREFTWQVQGIGHFVKIAAGAMFKWTILCSVSYDSVGGATLLKHAFDLRSKWGPCASTARRAQHPAEMEGIDRPE